MRYLLSLQASMFTQFAEASCSQIDFFARRHQDADAWQAGKAEKLRR